MKKLGTIITGLLMGIVAVLWGFTILSNVVENFRLVTGGTVTQGIISSPAFCPWGKYAARSDRPLVVQFTGTGGRQQEAVALECGGIPFRQAGQHVSIVYLPQAPTLARIQGDLVLQFWLLEAPCLLIVLVIFFTLAVARVKRIQRGS